MRSWSAGWRGSAIAITLASTLTACEWAPALCVTPGADGAFVIAAGRTCADHSATRRLRVDDADTGRVLWVVRHTAGPATDQFRYGVVPSSYVEEVAATPLDRVCRVTIYSDWSSTTVPATLLGGAGCP